MQAMKEDPPADFKCKDKFLVQSVAITAERAGLSLAELWPAVERDARDQIREKKIRCAFLPPLEHAITQIREEESEHVSPPHYTPTQQAEPATVHAPASPIISASSAPVLTSKNSFNSTSDVQTLKRELESAQEIIQNLQSSLDKLQKETNTLRQRKVESSSPSSAPTMTAVHLNQPQGLYPTSIQTMLPSARTAALGARYHRPYGGRPTTIKLARWNIHALFDRNALLTSWRHFDWIRAILEVFRMIHSDQRKASLEYYLDSTFAEKKDAIWRLMKHQIFYSAVEDVVQIIMGRLDTYIYLASQDDDGDIGLNGHLSDLRSIDCGTEIDTNFGGVHF
ncbi:phosphatidylinositol-binding protein scs2 [Podila verticillata]|nr:phosphatidylinositol-binding protein scs2 [Podila verticillata]